MKTDELVWKLEAACRNAWPAATDVVSGSWLFRRSGGTTRRINSVNPVEAQEHDVDAVLPEAKAFYAGYAQPLILRVPSFLTEVEARLEHIGFRPEAQTSTLLAELSARPWTRDAQVELLPKASDGWLEAKRRMTPASDAQQRAFAEMLERIELPVRFASLAAGSRLESVGYGAIDRDVLVIEAVVTGAAHRRLGLARRLVESLMAWARSEGAERACLQVMTDNLPALGLYRRLGFDRTLYDYSYYRFPSDDATTSARPLT